MCRRLLVIAGIAVLACRGPAGPAGPAPGPGPDGLGRPAAAGDPTPPGLRLPAGFTPTRYRARLAIDPAQPGFTGAIEIEGELAAPTSLVWLHAEGLTFERAVATAGGREIALDPLLHDEVVGLRAARELPAGPVVLALDYRGSFEVHDSYGAFVQEAKGDRYVFTQMEPTGARRVFPSVDEPWSKVPWELTLDVPAGTTALGNAPVAREEATDAGRRVVFAPSQPLPTYLVAFAVGPFDLVDAGTTPGGAPIRIATPRGRAGEAAWAAEVTPKLVAILEDWFGTPYPYEKLDSVAIPMTAGFSGMENAGLITYRETRILIDPADASEDARRAFVVLAAHEIAHHWFGDLVTPAWWDDLWLNEAFANWMEEKVMGLFSPAWGLRVPVVVERDRALHADGLITARRVRQPIESADDIATAFDRITYDKGAAVIRMFEAWIGADDFRDGVRAYLAKHAGGVATSADFLAAIDAASDLDVTAAFQTFLDQAGAPRLAAELRCEDRRKGPAVITLAQDRWLPRGSAPPAGEPVPRWTIPVCVAHGAAKTRQVTCTVLDGLEQELTLEGKCPTWFLPNADGKGYYRMGLSRDALDDLLGSGWKQLAPHERVLLAGDVRAAVIRGELALGAELDLVSRLVRDGSRHAIEMAVTIARDALDAASDASRPALVAWIEKTFGPRARKLGFLPDKGDGLDEELTRAALLPLVTQVGAEKKLLTRAVDLARDWRGLTGSVRRTVLGAALQTSGEVRAALRAAALAPTDAREARDVFDSLGALRDPEEAKAALEVLLDPEVDLKHGRHLLHGLAADPRTQPVAEAFLREHLAELLPRMPEGGAADLVEVVTASCDAGKRADAEAWAKQHIEPLDGGLRTSAQALEQMDLCIARRAAMAPELDAWLEARK